MSTTCLLQSFPHVSLQSSRGRIIAQVYNMISTRQTRRLRFRQTNYISSYMASTQQQQGLLGITAFFINKTFPGDELEETF